ncbi:MAG: GNAT family protein [Bacteroidota bacterium]
MKSTIFSETHLLSFGENYSLHLPHLEHAEELFQLVDKNRAYLSQWLEWVQWTKEVKDTEEFTVKSIEQNENREQLDTTIFAGERIVGKIGFIKLNHKYKSAEIGYWLSEDEQGRGIMTQAVKALMKYGFETFDLNRIVIGANAENWSSRNIPERLGFQFEGTFRQDRFYGGQFWDSVVYSKLRWEWEEENKKKD